jgi:hypothetical protein
MPEDSTTAPAQSRRPLPLRLAVVLVAVEAGALLAFTVWFTVDVFPVGDPVAQRTAMALGVIVFLLGMCAVLAAAARSLGLLQHWPRALLVAVQLIGLGVGFPLAQDGLAVGWGICVVALVVLGALFAPATTAAIER